MVIVIRVAEVLRVSCEGGRVLRYSCVVWLGSGWGSRCGMSWKKKKKTATENFKRNPVVILLYS